MRTAPHGTAASKIAVAHVPGAPAGAPALSQECPSLLPTESQRGSRGSPYNGPHHAFVNQDFKVTGAV
jgi:hypothetical protein